MGLAAITLPKNAQDELRTAYSSKATTASLDWIDRLHHDHSLNHCPVCGGLGARTIDHHLPKANYPEFSIFAPNLIPCCGTCNSKRGNANKPGVPQTTLHPYFDSAILDAPLVFIKVRKPWCAPEFQLLRLPQYKATRERVKHHVRTSVDSAAFGTWAKGYWGDFRSKIAAKYQTAIQLENELKRMLATDADSHGHNSWQAALSRGVAKDQALMQWLVSNPVNVGNYTAAQLGI
ncbi:hypothetical protein [Stenotrophomonas maltophilia]|uniref:hypothetical protein n=1 Tax=Stenotrophomonas muris TaxID=2963283 RepID=UPI001F52C1D1|nr:hypothetical protein [Stenotrophomonas maltophilia]